MMSMTCPPAPATLSGMLMRTAGAAGRLALALVDDAMSICAVFAVLLLV